ncbi:MAG: hypothetical protein FWH10_03420 [Oscillospiraceae bacterium]|nr:hypothetical protein [Oscillospiraceae bacterium]
MRVIYVMEQKPKIIGIIKTILREQNDSKNIFLYGGVDFSPDIKDYITENNILIFKFQSPDNINYINNQNNNIDLLVLGDLRRFDYNYNKSKIETERLGNIKSILLNIENSGEITGYDKSEQIITCGLKEKDTFIFSSINIDEGSVILDLQRSMKDIDGEILEPFEKQIIIPEEIREESSEDLILSLTVLCYCGRI